MTNPTDVEQAERVATDPEHLTDALDLIREHPADVLRRNPRQWGRISEHLASASAASIASKIRCGVAGGHWTSPGPFQTIYQAEGDVFVVYARYVGQSNGGAR
jgi:hypothetical protein